MILTSLLLAAAQPVAPITKAVATKPAAPPPSAQDTMRKRYDTCVELATGDVDGHVGYGESAWDVMGAWPILTALGATSTVDWARTPLDAKLRFVIGKPDLVAACRSLGR